MHNMDTGMLNI